MPSFKAMPDGTNVANILFTGALLILIALSFAIALVANSRHQMRSATLSGWLFASARGWNISWFFVAPLPMLTAGNRTLVQTLNGWHQNFVWALLIVAGMHVAAAFVHLFYYRDGVMRRMLHVGSATTQLRD